MFQMKPIEVSIGAPGAAFFQGGRQAMMGMRPTSGSPGERRTPKARLDSHTESVADRSCEYHPTKFAQFIPSAC